MRGVYAQRDVRDRHLFEVALCAAWHVAAWNTAAKVGKLEEWGRCRAKLFGATDAPVAPKPQDWRARKLERQQQIKQLRKHQKQRNRKIHIA